MPSLDIWNHKSVRKDLVVGDKKRERQKADPTALGCQRPQLGSVSAEGLNKGANLRRNKAT